MKYVNNKREKTNYESLEGSSVKVLEKIDNFNSTGVVLLNGLEWTARSVDDSIIPAGKKVIVKEVSGVKLIVEEEREGV
ncbi:hypothetical protein D3C81_2200310 [compost metagenome]